MKNNKKPVRYFGYFVVKGLVSTRFEKPEDAEAYAAAIGGTVKHIQPFGRPSDFANKLFNAIQEKHA